jgi:hypothetical protein
MDKQYLTYTILAPKINTIVKLLSGEDVKKIKHYWFQERCFYYPEYQIQPVDEDFIVRLSFYSSGVRERIANAVSDDIIIKELKNVYKKVFLKCYYNYGPKSAFFEICHNFHDEVEKVLNKDILGCFVSIRVTRFWFLKLKSTPYELIQKDKVLSKGKISKYGSIVFTNKPKGKYILKIFQGNNCKMKSFKIKKFSQEIRINLF